MDEEHGGAIERTKTRAQCRECESEPHYSPMRSEGRIGGASMYPESPRHTGHPMDHENTSHDEWRGSRTQHHERDSRPYHTPWVPEAEIADLPMHLGSPGHPGRSMDREHASPSEYRGPRDHGHERNSRRRYASTRSEDRFEGSPIHLGSPRYPMDQGHGLPNEQPRCRECDPKTNYGSRHSEGQLAGSPMHQGSPCSQCKDAGRPILPERPSLPTKACTDPECRQRDDRSRAKQIAMDKFVHGIETNVSKLSHIAEQCVIS